MTAPYGDERRRDPSGVDYRFTLANERTFLAWVRTSLALVAAGVGVIGLASHFSTATGRRVLGLGLLALGGLSAVSSYLRWRRAQEAMRAGGSLPGTRLIVVLGGGLTVIAVVGFALAVAQAL